MMALSKFQKTTLEAGWHANFYVSASDWGNPEFHKLIQLGFLHYWSTSGGFPAFRTTEAGRAALKEQEGPES